MIGKFDWKRPLRTRGMRRSLATAARFKNTLEVERQRTDRSGIGFSLLALTLPAGSDYQHCQDALMEILSRRLRTTDDVGWLDDGRIGVILPYTAPGGAWAVVNNICLDFSTDLRPPACAVYAYPHHEGVDADPVESLTPARRERSVEALESMFVLHNPPWKRAIDLLGACVGLVLLSPVILAAAAAVRISSPGAVFFRQQRAGHGGRPFTIYKLRTMVADAEAKKAGLRSKNEQDGPAFKIRNDPRVTPLGRFLRKTSIDELPQLWNVVLGDMSLVGPRPLPIEEAAKCIGWQQRRLHVKPGLTCIWQIEGRSRVTFAEWARMDIRYIGARSLLQDLTILLRTLPAVLFQRGAR